MNQFRPNQFRHASSVGPLAEYRDGWWRTFEPQPAVERVLCGKPWRLRPGLTFTPYANPRPCNAHCTFCSEELLRKDASRLSAVAVIRDHDQYFAGLARAWDELRGFPMGMSLSGLEATSDPAWMLRLLSLIESYDELFPEKVLYSNGTGLCTHDLLIDALHRARFDRVELSRCHFDAKINQRIMRFDNDQPIRGAEAFDETVRRLQGRVKVKLSCIVNARGVAIVDDVESYIAKAAQLGVERIVFRELSALGDSYVDNFEVRWSQQNRVSVRTMMDLINPDGGSLRDGWRFLGVTSGYYYYNELYQRDGVDVILEASSYVAHHEVVRSGVLQKLVFHSTGDLCGDWVPNSLWVGNYY